MAVTAIAAVAFLSASPARAQVLDPPATDVVDDAAKHVPASSPTVPTSAPTSPDTSGVSDVADEQLDTVDAGAGTVNQTVEDVTGTTTDVVDTVDGLTGGVGGGVGEIVEQVDGLLGGGGGSTGEVGSPHTTTPAVGGPGRAITGVDVVGNSQQRVTDSVAEGGAPHGATDGGSVDLLGPRPLATALGDAVTQFAIPLVLVLLIALAVAVTPNSAAARAAVPSRCPDDDLVAFE